MVVFLPLACERLFIALLAHDSLCGLSSRQALDGLDLCLAVHVARPVGDVLPTETIFVKLFHLLCGGKSIVYLWLVGWSQVARSSW